MIRGKNTMNSGWRKRATYNVGRNAAKRKAREESKRYKGPARTPKGTHND